MAKRDIAFPALRKKIAATFPGDLRVSRVVRGDKIVDAANFEVVYVNPKSTNIVVTDTFGLRAAIFNDSRLEFTAALSNESRSESTPEPNELKVISLVCTVPYSEGGAKCTIL